MRVTLDQAPLATTFPTGSTLQGVIDAVRAQTAGDRLVIAVALNGEHLAVETLDDLLSKPLGDDDSVELESRARRDLAREAFEELGAAFEGVRWKHAEIADRIAEGQHAEAVRDVGTYVELWRNCQQGLRQCSELLSEDLTAYEYHGLPLVEYLKSAVQVLMQVRAALESQDYVALTDVVRYELPMLSETWGGICGELASYVAANDGGTAAE